MRSPRPPAFILFGGFMARYFPGIWRHIKQHELALLIIDDPDEVLEKQRRRTSESGASPFDNFDEIAHVTPSDTAGMLEQVRQWSAAYDIRGVASARDSRVVQTSLAADMLGLPHPGLRAATVCTNKCLQRLYLPEWSPPFACVTPARRARFHPPAGIFPAVLKPVARSSSIGVQKILSPAELEKALPAYAEDEVLILEGFQTGREYSVEALIQHGQVIFENVTQKIPKQENTRYLVEIGHSMPATDLTAEQTDRLLTAHRQILQRLGFQNGYGGAEYRLTSDGRVYLAEVAARCPGDGILPLYLLSTGEAMEEAVVKIALGIEARYPPTARFAKVIYMDHPHGRFRGMVKDGFDEIELLILPDIGVRPDLRPGAAGDPPAVREILSGKSLGEDLGEMTNAYDRSVSITFDAPTAAELSSFEGEILQRCRILVEPA